MTSRDHRIQNFTRNVYYIPPEKFLLSNRSLVQHAQSKLLYNELAFLYDLVAFRDSKQETDFLHKIISLFEPNAKHILDVGCGVGRHDELLCKKYGYYVTGIDISGTMVQLAKSRCPSCKFMKMDMRKIKLKLSNCFDVAICMWSTFNYLSNPEDTKSFFNGIHKSLRKAGLLIIDMKNYQKKNVQCFSRQAKNDLYSVKLSVHKRVIRNIGEGVYFYLIKDLKTGEEFFALDQELNKVYTLEEVLAMAIPLFKPVKIYGNYNYNAEFAPNTSKRIILVLRKSEKDNK